MPIGGLFDVYPWGFLELMGTRGRKSSAELTVVARAAQVLVVKRPEPPECLSDEAAAEWREVVATFAADHFNRALFPVLEAYCDHAVARRKVAQIIRDLEEGDEWTAGRYNTLRELHDRESRSLQALAVRLGIATATHVPTKNRAVLATKPLWER